MLTVYGIETLYDPIEEVIGDSVATVLTVYGIETVSCPYWDKVQMLVATVLTVYGIETQFRCIQSFFILNLCCNSAYRLRY